MSRLSKSLKAYGGWFSGLIGGLIIGFGIMLLLISPLIVSVHEAWTNEINDILNTWRSLHPNDDIPTAQIPSEVYYGYANVRLWGAIAIFIGLIIGVIGLYEIHHSLKTVSSEPLVMEKKYCRYCGAENKSDAIFCEKCGKKM